MSVPLQTAVAKHGYVVIPRHRPDLATIEALYLLGSALTLAGFSTIQELRPHAESSAPPNTYSGNFGTGEFPMHTDLAHWAVPPRYLALRCIQGAPEVATGVVDGNLMIDDLGPIMLRRTLVQPRRPLRNGKQLLRLLDYVEDCDATVLRWDSLFLRPATSISEVGYWQVSKYIDSMIVKDVALLAPGDTLIVDNWRMFHRRSAVPSSAATRHIDRVYMGALH